MMTHRKYSLLALTASTVFAVGVHCKKPPSASPDGGPSMATIVAETYVADLEKQAASFESAKDCSDVRSKSIEARNHPIVDSSKKSRAIDDVPAMAARRQLAIERITTRMMTCGIYGE